MRRKISIRVALVIFAAFALFILFSTFIVQKNINEVSELNLNQYLSMITIDYNEGLTPVEIVDKYSDLSDYLRITFIAEDGTVIKDSLADATDMDNHLSRPEFQDLGTVYIRTSATLNQRMMYLATQLSDQTYLRVSIPTESILPFLNDFIGLSIIIASAVIALSILMIYTLTKSALTPLKEISNNLEKVSKGEYVDVMPLEQDDEINIIIQEINELNHVISSHLASLNEEKKKNDFLMDHMDQGICVLNNQGKVILVNKFLRDLFHFAKSPSSKDYLYLFRQRTIQEAIENAYRSETNTSALVEIEGNFYSVMISYLPSSWNDLSSVVLIFTDVTMIKNIENLKRDFFINASHELKSPLTSIMGSSELISTSMVTDPETIRDLSLRILEESTRMNHLVMDMLNLSKYENQTESVTDEIVQLNQIYNDVKKSIENSLSKKEIVLEENISKISYKANPEHMYQVFRNLIENAIQYGNQKGFVKVVLKEENDQIFFSVEDNGIGIPKDDQSRVFERFYRVDKARSKKTGGTGLGLSIVKHISLLYQGHIQLESTEGKGTKITVVFPVHRKES